MSELSTVLKKMFPHGAHLHTPDIGEMEKTYVMECLDSTFVSSVGPTTLAVEKKLSEFCQSQFTVAVSCGTSALHLSLHALGVGPGDLVIVPSITFVASANAVLYTGAEALFLDVDMQSWGLCPEKLRNFLTQECTFKEGVCHYKKTNATIKALMLVHLFGIPAQIDPILDVCKQYNIELVEDAAEALGSFYKGRHVGTFGKVGILSFNGNKITTAGGGGAILCQDQVFAKKLKHLSTTAKASTDFTYFHDQLGFNYRMPNINAALLLAQLERLPLFLAQKKALHLEYAQQLKFCTSGILQSCPENSQSNYWLNNFILSTEAQSQHRQILEDLNQEGFFVRPIWNQLNTLPYFKNCPRSHDLENSTRLCSTVISLPSSSHLSYQL